MFFGFLTTILDTIGLLFVAAGVVFELEKYIGLASLAAGGFVILAGSWYAQRE